MGPLKRQFFISYAVIGCVNPLLPVFLKEEKHFTEFEIGINQALTSVATLLAPALITLLADTRFDSRRILAVAFLVSASAFALMGLTSGIIITLMLYMMHSVAFIPTVSLLDGYYFRANRSGELSESKPSGYHQVRVWGTIGFMVPSLIFFFLLRAGLPHTIILVAAVVVGIGSALHTFLLPRTPELPARSSKGGVLPSREALSILLGPRGRFFCLALFLAFAASTAYHGFFPLYLKNMIGVDESWIGIIINVGVFFEIFYILALGSLRKRFRLRTLMMIGLGAMTVRLILLASVPCVATAVLTQLLHGAEICAVFVLPVMYLDQLASDHFRNSIQGVYTMVVLGGSRIVGSLIAGRLAEVSLIWLFIYAATLAAASFLTVALLFKPEEPEEVLLTV